MTLAVSVYDSLVADHAVADLSASGVLLGVVGGYLTPAERRLGHLAGADGSSRLRLGQTAVDRVATVCFRLAVGRPRRCRTSALLPRALGTRSPP